MACDRMERGRQINEWQGDHGVLIVQEQIAGLWRQHGAVVRHLQHFPAQETCQSVCIEQAKSWLDQTGPGSDPGGAVYITSMPRSLPRHFRHCLDED